jgi:hypothetical protein
MELGALALRLVALRAERGLEVRAVRLHVGELRLEPLELLLPLASPQLHEVQIDAAARFTF